MLYIDNLDTDYIIAQYCNGFSSVSIARDVGVSPVTIRKLLRFNGVSIRAKHVSNRKYIVKNDYFENIDTENKAYWLGYLYADGNVSESKTSNARVKLHLQTKDECVLHALASEIFVSEYKLQKYKNSVCLEIYSAKIRADLIKHGCAPNKTFLIRMPNLRADLIRHFLRGIFDGDGCIYIENGKRCRISLISNHDFVINDVRDHLRTVLDLSGGCISKIKSGKIANVSWSCKSDILKLIDYLYTGNSICLNRKYEKAMLALSVLDSVKGRNAKIC